MMHPLVQRRRFRDLPFHVEPPAVQIDLLRSEVIRLEDEIFALRRLIVQYLGEDAVATALRAERPSEGM